MCFPNVQNIYWTVCLIVWPNSHPNLGESFKAFKMNSPKWTPQSLWEYLAIAMRGVSIRELLYPAVMMTRPPTEIYEVNLRWLSISMWFRMCPVYGERPSALTRRKETSFALSWKWGSPLRLSQIVWDFLSQCRNVIPLRLSQWGMALPLHWVNAE